MSSATTSDAAVPSLSNFINGAFVTPVDGAFIPNYNPATNHVICQIPSSNKADVDLAAASAKAALPAWKAFSFEQRATFLDKIANEIERRADEISRVESEDSGKTLSLASRVDIPRAVANFRFFAGAIRHDEVGAHHMADAVNITSRTPVGIAGLITPVSTR